MPSTPYTIADLVPIFGFSAKTIREWCKHGVFPGAEKFPDDRPRSEWRIPREDVEAKLRRKSAGAEPVSRERLDQLMDAALARAS